MRMALPLSAWCSFKSWGVLLQVWGPPLCDASGQCPRVRPNNGSVRLSRAQAALEPSCSSGFSVPTHVADGLLAHQARLSISDTVLPLLRCLSPLCAVAIYRCSVAAMALAVELLHVSVARAANCTFCSQPLAVCKISLRNLASTKACLAC